MVHLNHLELDNPLFNIDMYDNLCDIDANTYPIWGAVYSNVVSFCCNDLYHFDLLNRLEEA